MNSKRMFLKSSLAGAALVPGLAVATTDSIKSNLAGPRAAYFPNAVLETHEGKRVRFYDNVIQGKKIVIINMVYTGCSNICPPNTANLMRVQEMLGERIGRDIFMYSLTLQPELDTPQVLQQYVKKYGIKPGWTFLTGQPNDVDLIRRKLGFFDRDPVVDADLSQHAGMVRIGREASDRWSMMPALLTPKQLVNSILRL